MNDEKRHGKLASEFTRLHSLVSGLSVEKQQHLLDLYVTDPVLSDLSKVPCLTSEYVDSLIKLETGQAYPVNVEKFSGEKIELVVSPDSKIRDLKLAIQSGFERATPDIAWRISWKKGVWKTYCLAHNGVKLIEPEATLSSYGIKKNALIYFMKIKDPKKF